MQLKRFVFFVSFIVLSNFANAQILDSLALFKANDTIQIEYCINRFFEGLEKQDTLKLKEALYNEMTLKTILENTQENKEKFVIETKDELIKMVAKKRKVSINEKLLSWHINIDGRLASVWTPYEFYINNQPSHRGANNFQLVKTDKGWKIFSIVDTRHR